MKDSPLISVPGCMQLSNESTSRLDQCWKCSGSGFKTLKIKSDRSSRRVSASVPCGACKGSGKRSLKSKPQIKNALRPFRPLYDWNPSGPLAAFTISDPHVAPKENEMLCSLSGHWCIYQLIDGHRFTTDDVLTAACAVRSVLDHNLTPKNYIDLGTGLGSVLLMVSWKLHDSLESAHGLEAQSTHLKLAERSILFNDCQDLVHLHHGDLRTLQDVKSLTPNSFDLLTGTPPYFPPSEGILPTVSARGMCSFELRGGIEVYFEAAAFLMAQSSTSRFIVCQTSIEIKRTEIAAEAVGMHVIERWDVYGKKGRGSPLFSVFSCCWESEVIKMEESKVVDIYVRDTDDRYTLEMIELMKLLGKPIPRDYFTSLK